MEFHLALIRTADRAGARQPVERRVDGVINEDRLGLDAIYIQAKRWESTVGRPVVRAFAGSLEGVRGKPLSSDAAPTAHRLIG